MRKQATELSKLRSRIDAADSAILAALGKRLNIVKKIGIHKRKNKIEPFDAKLRDKRKREWLTRAAKLKLPKKLVSDIYKAVHDQSVEIERNAK